MTEPRVPPHDASAEQAVLGGLMLSTAAFDRVAPILTAEDFYDKRHQILFKAISALASEGTPHDAVTLGDWYDRQGIADLAGGVAYIWQIANGSPSAANVTAYAAIVREKATLRRAMDVIASASDRCWSKGAKPQEAIDETIRALMGLQRMETGAECTMRQATKRAYDKLSEVYARGSGLTGLTTGLIDLDAKLGGLHGGDLVVIGARPSMGKTSMLLGMLLAAARAGEPVGLISGEQPAEQIAQRTISALSRVSGSRLRSAEIEDEEWPRITNAMGDCAELPVWMLDRSAPELAEVMRVARSWAHAHSIRALYVDYLQRIVAPGERRFEAVGEIARGLKNLARDLDIPVIVLAQVNRQVESRTDKRPRMGDLADSGEIEKEADQILMLYRDEYYNSETEKPGLAELIVEKNRHGPTGFINLAWRANTMEFENFSGDEDVRYRQTDARPIRGRGNPGADRAGA